MHPVCYPKKTMLNINPDILKWARETAGLSKEEAVKKLGIKEAHGVPAIVRLENLESGKTAPKRSMIVKMSKQYRRPLLTFYLSKPPRIGDRGEDFRTLPDTVSISDTVLTDVVIRDIQARQALVRAVLEDEDEAEALPFIGSIDIEDGIAYAVESIRRVLDFNLDKYRAEGQLEHAFAYLRATAERAGIFVLLVDNLGSYHTTIDVEVFRGFALADDVAPFVAVNANDSKGAWSFTLVHEIAHLWLGASGVSGYSAEKAIEKFCNDIASEFLLPNEELENLIVDPVMDFDEMKSLISNFAHIRNVSSTMVAYRLSRNDRIDYGRFVKLRHAYRRDFIAHSKKRRKKNKESESGPNYYVVRQHRLGTSLVGLVKRMMLVGALTTTKAGKVLGVKPKNVQGVLETVALGHAAEPA